LVAYPLLHRSREAGTPDPDIDKHCYRHGEMTMKTIAGTGFSMIDCGSVTRQTRGLTIGFFYEGAPPPFQWTIYH
jgi:hypothetical protein